MKLGGNGKASKALNIPTGKGGMATPAKYSSKLAIEYKSRLLERVKNDEKNQPDDPFLISKEEGYHETFQDPLNLEETMHDKQASTIPGFQYDNPWSSGASSSSNPLATNSRRLGAIKATNIDFEELEKQQKQETKETKEIITAPALIPKKIEKSITEKPSSPIPSSPNTLSKEQEATMDRLGMGLKKKMAIKQAENTTLQSDKVKSVSSDKYFKRDQVEENPEENHLHEERLYNIQGMTGVSSDQYFGKLSPKDQQNDTDNYHHNRQSKGTIDSIIKSMDDYLKK